MLLLQSGCSVRYGVDVLSQRSCRLGTEDLVTFLFRGYRRSKLLSQEERFEWRPAPRDEGPVFRDLSWDLEEPDHYPTLVAAQKPGLMASRAEKALHAAVASGDPEAMLDTAAQHPKHGLAATTIAGLLMLESDLDRGLEILDRAVATADVGDDRFVHEYLPEAGLSVVIAAGVMVRLPLQRNSLVLLLAELHQARGDYAEAIAMLEQTEPTSHIRLSLTEILYETGQYERVAELTQNVFNDDDVTALTLAYRGRALAALGFEDRALASLNRALEYPNRADSVLALAHAARAAIHRTRGEREAADDDFARALAQISGDPDAESHIRDLIGEASPPN